MTTYEEIQEAKDLLERAKFILFQASLNYWERWKENEANEIKEMMAHADDAIDCIEGSIEELKCIKI